MHAAFLRITLDTIIYIFVAFFNANLICRLKWDADQRGGT